MRYKGRVVSPKPQPLDQVKGLRRFSLRKTKELMDTRLYSPTHPQLTSPIPNVQTEKEPVCVYVCVCDREREWLEVCGSWTALLGGVCLNSRTHSGKSEWEQLASITMRTRQQRGVDREQRQMEVHVGKKGNSFSEQQALLPWHKAALRLGPLQPLRHQWEMPVIRRMAVLWASAQSGDAAGISEPSWARWWRRHSQNQLGPILQWCLPYRPLIFFPTMTLTYSPSPCEVPSPGRSFQSRQSFRGELSSAVILPLEH